MAKFGSVEWQNEQASMVLAKIAKGEELDDFEKTFIQIQSEHDRGGT